MVGRNFSKNCIKTLNNMKTKHPKINQRKQNTSSDAQQNKVAENNVLSNSPVIAAQKKQLESSFGSPIQRGCTNCEEDLAQSKIAVQKAAPEEEELLQGKIVAQKANPEEEELMQGKFTVQKAAPEEEDLLQGKLVAQKASPEEEELMQGKIVAQKSGPEEEELMQGKFVAQREESEDNKDRQLSGNFDATLSKSSADELMQQKPVQKQENKTGMPDEVKAKMESSFNTDFSGVKVHQNSSKAPEVGALAYTQGTDVHFAPGQYKPETSQGQQLLGHELAHVVQQSQGRVQPTTEVAGMPVNDNPSLEKEADMMGAKAAK